MDFIPLITSIIAFIFFIFLLRQYLTRKKIYQLIWTTSILFYSLTSLFEYLMNFGANKYIFMTYYFLAAPLVGFLGAGVLYLLASRRIAHLFMFFVVGLSISLIILGTITPVNEIKLVENFNINLAVGFEEFGDYYPMNVRIFSIILNSVGGTILIVGAIYSFIRDRHSYYNIFLAIGGILPSVGGSAMVLFNYPDIKFWFELGGIVFLFFGFLLSGKYIKKIETNTTLLDVAES